MLRAATSAQPRRIWRLPAGFAPLPLLPSAGAPVRAGRYASPSVRRHTSPSTASQRLHLKGPGIPGSHDNPELSSRLAAAPSCFGQEAALRSHNGSGLRCENFLYWDQGARSVGLATWFKPACTDATPSDFREPESSGKDRRRAGRWDREQLIGGKATEPRK